MSEVWQTKDGRRRVRRDPPSIEDAVLAAQGLSDEMDAQVGIVMSLMQVSAEAARSAVLRMGQRKETSRVTVVAGRAGVPRAVVVERRPSRAVGLRPRASAGYRGRE